MRAIVKRVGQFLLTWATLAVAGAAFAQTSLNKEANTTEPDAISSASLLASITKPVDIGIIILPNKPEDKRALDETVARIQAAFAPHEVRVHVLDSQTLERGIISGEIDAFIASAGYYARMAMHGAISVGTLISNEAPDPNNGVAGVFLVRKDQLDIGTIADLQGRSIATSFSTAFMGYRVGMAEIAVRGYDPENYFSEIRFFGRSDNREITQALAEGEVDSALITACWLEGQPAEVRNRFRVLNPRSDSMKCVHSTRTYPGITFAVTQGASPGVAHIISRTLLTMPHLHDGYHWGVATDIRAVDRLYKELKIENYAYLREWSVKRWIETYWYWLVFVAIIALGLVYHSWRVGILVKKRTAELVQTMEEKRQAQMKADAFREREEKMQKTMLIGQLSSMIAHELSQPLAAIKYYCDGQKALLSETIESKDLNRKMLEKSRTGIADALKNVTEIVEKVRSYKKGDAKRDTVIDLHHAIQSAVHGLNAQLLSKTHISVSGIRNASILADPLEAEILFHNLLKNAIEAANEGQERARIRISAVQDENRVIITIENNGKILDDRTFLHLTTPLMTTKATGTGLGIPIAMALAEASGGHLNFERRPEGGLRAIVTLVSAQGEETDD
ncbi:MAG: PhnD/SsuA/transferrin family substrate-binding protein [Sutterellaceae bacterium]|nr:PhnD/SsuA/transferrin family substrate-binding protein [Sutterellaceae bacterium]